MTRQVHTHAKFPFDAVRRLAGVLLHPSALPGCHGIGDIADSACWFVDQLVEMEVGLWQFLPLGPTAYGDSPYQPLSAFAGNANLLGPAALCRDGLLQPGELSALESLPCGYCDFGRLIPLKRALLRQAAGRFEAKAAVPLRAAYDDFLQRHAARWLDDYALFRALKTAHGERPWPEWTPALARREPAALTRARERHRDAIERTRILQFLFERQWRDLQDYAREHGVLLFGDMPIYLALDSADAWACRELLLLDSNGLPTRVAGVPPDYFSESGQLWGNPLYDWDYHRRHGYRWWIERLRHAIRRMDLVRIDHFRGFESYWSVPYGAASARDGEWLPGPGDTLFAALRQELGNLPLVAEDLGVITPAVKALRDRHRIPGMAVLQFDIANPGFDVEDIEENRVCYTGTHDNDTALGWFLGAADDMRAPLDIERTRARVLALTGGRANTVSMDLVELAFSSPAAVAVAPMQDLLGLSSEARFNRPGTTRDNWRWRMQAGQLSPELMAEVRDLVRQTSRGPT